MSSPASASPPRRWSARLRGWKLRMAVAVVALVLVVRAGLPLVVARLIERQASAAVGSAVWVGDVDLWLLRGALAIDRLAIARAADVGADARGALLAALGTEVDPFAADVPLPERLERLPPPGEEQLSLGLGRLYVDLSWGALFDGELHISTLEVDRIGALLELHGDGRLVWPGLRRAPEAAAADDAAPADADAGWPLRVERLVLRDSGVRVQATFEGAPEALDLLLGELSFGDIALASGRATVAAVTLDEVAARVRPHRFAAGGEPVDPDAVEEVAAEASPEPPAPPAAPGHRIERVDLERAQFTVLVGDAEPVGVTLRVSARELTLDPGETFPVEVDVGVADGSLQLRGRAGVAPPAFEGRVEWSALPLPVLAATGAPASSAWVRSGRSDGALDVAARLVGAEAGASERARLRGRVDVIELALEDPSGAGRSLAWQRLAVEVSELVLPLPAAGAPQVSLASVRLESPRAAWLIDEPPASEAKADLDAGEPEQAAPDAASAEGDGNGSPPIELRLASFRLSDGELRLVDRSHSPVARNGISDLALEASGLRYPELAVADLQLSAVSDEGGQLEISGAMTGEGSKLHVALAELALPPLSPHVAARVPYQFSQGEISLTSDAAGTGASYAVENRIELHHLRVDERESGDFQTRFGVPLDLALALLRGPGGDIALRLDFETRAEELDVGVGAAVASALRQAFIGALSSPLRALGSVVPRGGGGGFGLEPIAFEPGSSRLGSKGARQVGVLADLLARRPGLALGLTGATDAADRTALARALVDAAAVDGGDLPEVSEDGGFLARRSARRALARRAAGEEGAVEPEDEALIQRWYRAAEERLPAERLAALARARVAVVREALEREHRVPPERLRAAPEPAGDVAGVVVALET